MTLDQLEAIIWSQARNLTSTDDLQRKTSMDAIRVAAVAVIEQAIVDAWNDAPAAVAGRRAGLEEVTQ